MATAIVYSDQYLNHDTGQHPERRERYQATLSGLTKDEDIWSSLLKLEPREATDDLLRLCHDEETLELVQRICQQAKFFERAAIDSDTVVCARSGEIARLAAGGACRAVDAVVNQEAESAFVACRPPGHHATRDASMGFCLFNNVAIAARYAQTKYPAEIRNVLIVDFDVHHGNGTQDIFYGDPSVFYYSLHQYPWYPGTGAARERGEDEGEGYTLNIPVPAGEGDDEYLRLFEFGLEAAMKAATPDLILISAGFDAHIADPLGDLRLHDDCYVRMTKRLKEAARTGGKGRVVSCLEGGYNLNTLGGTVLAHVRALE
jgi:acetoin utilization deacetylase AcuC-like enzyme